MHFCLLQSFFVHFSALFTAKVAYKQTSAKLRRIAQSCATETLLWNTPLKQPVCVSPIRCSESDSCVLCLSNQVLAMIQRKFACNWQSQSSGITQITSKPIVSCFRCKPKRDLAISHMRIADRHCCVYDYQRGCRTIAWLGCPDPDHRIHIAGTRVHH